MPGLSVGRCGVDLVGGVPLLNPPSASRVFVNGKPIAVVGTTVTPHGKAPHNASKMTQGNLRVKAGGIPVCANTHAASCGHQLVSSSNVFVGS